MDQKQAWLCEANMRVQNQIWVVPLLTLVCLLNQGIPGVFMFM
jgi:hypothetical protein